MLTHVLLGLMVSESHGLRMLCLLKADTLKWVTYTVPFLAKINYIHSYGLFEFLQSGPERVFHAGPTSPLRVP